MRAMMAALKILSDGEYIDSPVIELSLRYSITPDPARLIFLPYSQHSLCQKHSVVHEYTQAHTTHTWTHSGSGPNAAELPHCLLAM